MLQSESWPKPRKNLHVRVLVHKETDTHSIDYTEDGILHLSTNPSATAPEYVQQSAHESGCAALNKAGIDALWDVLNEVRATIS